MLRITGYNLVSFINQLPKDRFYNYVNPNTKLLIKIVDVKMPGGPILIKRIGRQMATPGLPSTVKTAPVESISTEMIWRIANAFYENQPINFDRVLGGSYNTRSVLEALIAHTPHFYFCYPGRIFDMGGTSSIEQGHKHLIWLPNEPHPNAELHQKDTTIAVSEIPTSAAVYESITLTDISHHQNLDIDTARRHTQIQIALYMIGKQLGYRSWIAQNDKTVQYNGVPLLQHEGVIKSLHDEVLVSPFEGAVNAGLFIDCIWFKNGRLMPAVMEVEHSTGITSGLDRMLNFYTKMPPFPTRYVIVAPDEDREKVTIETNKPMFSKLDAKYFPYSAVEELFVICQRRKLRGVTEEFLDCYMESTIV